MTHDDFYRYAIDGEMTATPAALAAVAQHRSAPTVSAFEDQILEVVTLGLGATCPGQA